MAALNPNPSRVTNAIWDLWIWFDQLEPTVSLGGIYAAKGGYHDEARPGDYSVVEVSTDREGPRDKASAIDLTMSDAAMRKYTARLDAAAKARDERLFIGGQAIIREFIGTKDSRYVYCYVLVGGRARGLASDASEDWNRDSSHLWHLHISIIRKFCANADAMDRLWSVLAGESLSAWRARRAPAPAAPEEDDMPFQPIPVPRGFAYAADENWIPGNESALSLPLPPAGSIAANPVYREKHLFLSFGTDHNAPDRPVKVRVAMHSGGGYTVKIVDVTKGPRVSVPVPAATGDSGYNVTIGRVTTDVPEHATLPLGVLVEIV